MIRPHVCRRMLAFQFAAAMAVISASSLLASPPRIGFGGYDEVRIGMTLWELLRVMGGPTTIESIEGGCTHVYASSSGTPELLFMVVDGSLVRIEVRTSGVVTLSGVTVGSTEREVEAAYPGRVVVSDHEYQDGHYLTIYSTDGKSALVFDTDGAEVRSFRIGRLPEALHVEGCS